MMRSLELLKSDLWRDGLVWCQRDGDEMCHHALSPSLLCLCKHGGLLPKRKINH